MRPEFDIAVDFFKRSLIDKGFSGNIQWLFRENILVKKGNRNRYSFTLNIELNEPNKLVRTVYDRLKKDNREIFFFTFIKADDLTYVTIAGEDYDFEMEDGDIFKREWDLKLGYNCFWDFKQDEIKIQTDTQKWTKMKNNESKDIGPFDYFYVSGYIK